MDKTMLFFCIGRLCAGCTPRGRKTVLLFRKGWLKMKRSQLQVLSRAAIIAALYAALTMILHPISYGPVQFRAAEALTLLPVICAEAVPGLFIGCLLANLLGGAVWYDVVFGSIATLLAAFAARRLRKIPALAAAMPVLSNGLIVGAVVYLAYIHLPGSAIEIHALLGAMGSVALGELVICYALGLPLLSVLRRMPKLFPDAGK